VLPAAKEIEYSKNTGMSKKVNIFYRALQEYMQNPGSVRVTGNTVGECLDDLEKQFPGVKKLIFDSSGKFLRQVFVYVNSESAHKAGLSDPVTDRDELLIAVLITGG
jgi:hypothetical protein